MTNIEILCGETIISTYVCKVIPPTKKEIAAYKKSILYENIEELLIFIMGYFGIILMIAGTIIIVNKVF